MSENSSIKRYLKKKNSAIRNGKNDILWVACVQLAEAYSKIGRSRDAIDEYQSAATILKDLNKRIEYGTVHRMIGEIYATHFNDYDKALEYHSIHLTAALEENDKPEEQRALTNIGRTYFHAAIIDPDNINKSLLSEAYNAYSKSLTICESLSGISKYEIADMKARLWFNIANIHIEEDNFQKALPCLESAIEITKSMNLNETLVMVLNRVAELFVEKKDYVFALKYLNEAYEAADRLFADKDIQLCEILQEKAKIFMKMENFRAAKNELMRAYKLQISDQSVRENVEQLLKMAAFVYYTEKELLSLQDDDYAERKVKYEKLGDCACRLQNYQKAIFYYEQMLSCVEAMHDNGPSLSAAYVSLAQTHKDNSNYHMAFHYFEKELQRCCSKPEETVPTLINLAEINHWRGDKFEDVMKYLNKAREKAKIANSRKLEYKVLEYMVHICEEFKKNDIMEKLKKELRNLNTSDETQDRRKLNKARIYDIRISDISDGEVDIKLRDSDKDSEASFPVHRKRALPIPSSSSSTTSETSTKSNNTTDSWLIDDMEQHLKRKRWTIPVVNPFKSKFTRNRSQLNKRKKVLSKSLPTEVSSQTQSPVELSEAIKNLSNNFKQKANNNSAGKTQTETLTSKSTLNIPFPRVLRIDVHILDTLWILPIEPSKTQVLKVDWLAKEAAKRYYNQEGRLPILKFKTKNQGILHNEDPVAIVTYFNELYSEITWNTPPINVRYDDQCSFLKMDVDQLIFHYLEYNAQGTVLNFYNFGITHEKAKPLIKALRYHTHVVEINFDSNFLDDDNLMDFFEILPTIPQVEKVSFSCNAITWKGISTILETCLKYNRSVQLSELDFSFNTLGNHCFKDLLSLLSFLKIRNVKLSSCKFDKNLLENITSLELFKGLKTLSSIDLSKNCIGATVISQILHAYNHHILKELYLESTIAEHKDDKNILSKLIESFKKNLPLNLEVLDLKNCEVSHDELLKLLSILHKCNNLKELWVSKSEAVEEIKEIKVPVTKLRMV